jgi:prevent-host-death family protein
MKTVGAYEAKTRLAELLNRVERGEKVVITRHGIPVALLQPYPENKGADRGSTIALLRAFRKEHSLGDIDLKELIEEGRS